MTTNFYPIYWFGNTSECLFISGAAGMIESDRPVVLWPVMFSELAGKEVFDLKDSAEVDRRFYLVKVGFC